MRKLTLVLIAAMIVFSIAFGVGFAETKKAKKEDCESLFKRFIGKKTYMNQQDFTECLRSKLGGNPNDSTSFWVQADKNQDNKLSMEEFCTWVKSR